MDKAQDQDERIVFETEDGGELVGAEHVAKIDDQLDLYVTDEGEEMLVSNDEDISGSQAMHRYLNSDAYMSMMEEASKEIDASDEEEDDETGAISEALDYVLDDDSDDEELNTEDLSQTEISLLSIVSEDLMLDNIQRIITVIENLTDEQVKNLGPDGVEEVFIALSKFYYTYMQNVNPLWEVAQARYRELKKWQKLYMDKYYHK